jgi:hypothetical protein
MTEQKSQKYGGIKKWPKITKNGRMKKMAEKMTNRKNGRQKKWPTEKWPTLVFTVFGVLN